MEEEETVFILRRGPAMYPRNCANGFSWTTIDINIFKSLL